MSKPSAILRVDMAAVERELLGGAKLTAVAAEVGVSAGWLCLQASARGVARAWTTAEERRLLSDLRAGRVAVVRTDCAPAAVRLAQRMEQALAEFRSALPASSASVPSVAKSASVSGS